MKRAINYSKIFFVLILITVSTISCKKNEFEVTPQDSEISSNASEVVTNKLGFLEFKDINVFNKTVSKLKSLPVNKRKAWEQEHNFTSLSTIYDIVLKGESDKLENLNIMIDDISKVNRNTFPEIHSESFKKFKSSIISTGDKIIDTPLMDINSTDYATVVDKDGFVRIGGALFQFKKNTIKATKVKGEVEIEDLEVTNKILKSNSETKVITVKNISNKNSKILQNGTESCYGGYNRYIVSGIVDYSDSYVIVPANTSGAIEINFFGLFSFWVVPGIHYHSTMHVSYVNLLGTIVNESNCPVYMDGTAITNGSVYGNTNEDGVFSHDSFDTYTVADLHIINTGFNIYDNYQYWRVASIFKYF